ncbi:transposon protein, putative, CACTA, En/Spm sub-class [Panicum miliaceum]|uniref:Transposon protein, putative, CACTA, En/Spm sub-class n=1 Tax=Panicum miliaceum TaxID=4540 RepID=A0A3L6RSQ2_PANMI|nr:transposon protein, putative, CACTA, En/Spm sub-class [Panicum miliaceum]
MGISQSPAFVAHPYEHGKPFATDEEFLNIPTQMRAFHNLYMERSNAGQQKFGVKYLNHDSYRGAVDFWVNFEDVHAIYRRDALDISIVTCWIQMELERCRKKDVMIQIRDEVLQVDMIVAVPEQLIGFILRENLDLKTSSTTMAIRSVENLYRCHDTNDF